MHFLPPFTSSSWAAAFCKMTTMNHHLVSFKNQSLLCRSTCIVYLNRIIATHHSDYVNNVTCPIMLKDTSVSSTSGPAPLPNPSSSSSTSWNWTSLIIYFEQVFLFLQVGRFWYLPRRCGTCCRPHCQKEKSCPTVPDKRNHNGTQRRCCWWRWMIMVIPVWPGRHWETALLVLLVWRQTHPDQVAVAPGVPLLKSRALKINKTDGKS